MTPPDLSAMTATELTRVLRAGHPDWPPDSIDAVLASFDVLADGTVRPVLTLERHLTIVRSMWDRRPSEVYPRVTVPVLLVPADGGDDWTAGRRVEVARAEAAIPRVRVVWLEGEHDLHAQRPDDVARLLHDATTDGFW
jgi:pimeloyl-ACP methyl ester carboxylesterase